MKIKLKSLTNRFSGKGSLELNKVRKNVEFSFIDEEMVFSLECQIHILHIRRTNKLFRYLTQVTFDTGKAKIRSNKRISPEQRSHICD